MSSNSKTSEHSADRSGSQLSYPNGRHPGVLPQVDLTQVMARVSRERPDWSPLRLTDAKVAYLNYLQLRSLAPNGQWDAPPDVDIVWKAHITFAEVYAEFCEEYYGYLLQT